jgi:membrane protease YdiL (CAAX protease family)
VWASFVAFLEAAGEALPIGDPTDLVNPVLYVVLPGAAALLLGARRREIGFARGWRSWPVAGVWSAPVVAGWLYALATGATGPGRIAAALLANTVRNGFGEEFLWRGVIQTRIARLLTPEWGLVLASLAFGWWHIGSIHDWAGDDLLLAASLNVVVQAPMGLALGVIFHRTRNLLAPTLVHVVANSVQP